MPQSKTNNKASLKLNKERCFQISIHTQKKIKYLSCKFPPPLVYLTKRTFPNELNHVIVFDTHLSKSTSSFTTIRYESNNNLKCNQSVQQTQLTIQCEEEDRVDYLNKTLLNQTKVMIWVCLLLARLIQFPLIRNGAWAKNSESILFPNSIESIDQTSFVQSKLFMVL